jgi:uncharacterized protein
MRGARSVRPSFFTLDLLGIPMISLEQARILYPPGQGTAHGFDHVLRVTALAERIARAEGADGTIVRAAALLHDLTATGPGRADHHITSAQRAREILLSMGHPAKEVEAVVHCILAHRFRSPGPGAGEGAELPPQTLEAQCVYDADKLDAIGAVGVARAFVHGAESGQPIWGEVSAEFKAGVPTGELHTAHHEFYFKLRHIRDRLYTATGRRIAAERHRYMAGFFERMALEVAGEA